jgi:hypothetical protein
VSAVTHPTDPSGRHGDSAPDEPVTLAGFLAARLDEEEEAAKAATPGPWRTHDTWLPAGGHTATVLSGDGSNTDLRAWLPTFKDVDQPWDSERNAWADAAHIALHDPARTLREVEAGRKLLARWHEADSRRSVSAEDEARAWLLDGLLADRAAVWPDHPEFGKGWLT